MKRALVLGLSLLAACNGGEPSMPEDAVSLEWGQGDEFHVATEYRAIGNKTAETAVDLENLAARATHDENWSDEVVWTFQSVESNYVPDATDELYEYAVKEDGSIAAITVLRAYVDASLNEDPELLESDPVVYMVFHADRDRLGAIVSFVNVNGERVESAFSTKELGRSYSALSQSMLTAAPTYLAPFSARYADEDKVLENGSLMETRVDDTGIVDVTYEDEMGGDVVISRYEDGQPWPTFTETDDVRSRLLSLDEVDARRLPLLPDPPENYDFRAALSSTIDLDNALILDTDTIDGGWGGGAPEGYRPWAGSWWPQSKGELVWSQHGFGDSKTLSSAGYAHLEPLKSEVDGLSDDLRDLDRESDEYKTKVEEYKTKQGEFVDQLVAYYNVLLQDLNGNVITFDAGKAIHAAYGEEPGHDSDWEVELDNLSPMDKYALQVWADGQSNGQNPFFAPAWELLNHYSPGARDGGWWGHCNGWAAVAILTNEPRESVTTQVKGEDMVWTHGDIKGLITETHYSTYSRFYGERFNKEEDGDDIKDLSPKHFHQIIQFYLRDQQVPLVFDTTADAPVWNYPAYWADVEVTETTEGFDASLININTATLEELDSLPGIGEAYAVRIIEYREWNGPFQAKEDITNVSGIGNGTLDGMSDLITVDVASNERTFDLVAAVKFTTDGVDEEHLDDNNVDPRGFTNTYRYSLTTDQDGVVISGEWDDEREHPDFAWVPYSNPQGFPRGGSENGYMSQEQVTRMLGSFDRK